jgi:hypothetical protein
MRYRARSFLAQWEFEHIKVVACANREEHARLLAERCRDDAAKVRINRWALEIVAGGDLISSMIQALNEAEFRQMCVISGRADKAIRLRLPTAQNERAPTLRTRWNGFARLGQTSSSIVGAVPGLYIRISRRILACIPAFAPAL